MLFMALASSAMVSSQSLTLAKRGVPKYVIVTPEEPSAVELTAADELKLHLDSITGGAFEICSEAAPRLATRSIYVGATTFAAKHIPNLVQVPYDGTVIKTVGKDLVLAGHPQRGALYAVYTLLEDVIGVRWWASDASFIPHKPTLAIPPQNIEYAPQLLYRDPTYKDLQEHPVTAARLKINGTTYRQMPPEYGGYIKWPYFIHSFFWWLPPEKYFAEHPDWYSMLNGKRTADRAQLCLTNEAMLAELTDKVLEYLRKNPDSRLVNIAQMDWHGYCECDRCKALAETEGSQSGAVVRCLNHVAEAVEKEFPEVTLTTLAYTYSRKPPRNVRPRKNVAIVLCTIECSFSTPISQGVGVNNNMRHDIEAWAKIAPTLYIWDYTTNFTALLLPHPNLGVLAPNIRFFINNNAKGLFSQGDEYSAANDFVRLKAYIISHLAWNPDADEQVLADEFINGYYGAAAAPCVKEYWRVLLESVKASNSGVACYMPTAPWLNAEALVKAEALMSQAISNSVPSTPEPYLSRLRRDKMPIDLAILQQYKSLKKKGLITADPIVLLDALEARAKEFNAMVYSEGDRDGKKWREKMDELRLKLADANIVTPIPDFCKSLPPDSWLEIQISDINYGYGAKLVDDPKASTGKALKLPPFAHDHLQYFLNDLIADLKPASPPSQSTNAPTFQIHICLRSQTTPSDEPAPPLTITLYDNVDGVYTRKAIPATAVESPDYQWLATDEFSLPKYQGPYICTSVKQTIDPNVTYVLDRMIIVRTK